MHRPIYKSFQGIMGVVDPSSPYFQEFCSALSASLLAGGPSVAAAGLGSVQGVAAAEEDDFLVVKRRDIYDAAPPEPAVAAPETGLHCLQPFKIPAGFSDSASESSLHC